MQHPCVGYIPDNSNCTRESLAYLITPSGKDLLKTVQALSNLHKIAISDLQRLRKLWPPQAIHAAITISICRQQACNARGKFPVAMGGSSKFWAIPEALQQATSLALARHKATRFAAIAPGGCILDACCGIGGDALGLADAGPVLAIEADPVRAWLAHRNVGEIITPHRINVIQADITRSFFKVPFDGGFHIDPARRNAGHRFQNFTDLFPGPTTIEKLIREIPYGAVKLSPACDFSQIPSGHLEIVSENGVTVQAILWTGRIGTHLGLSLRTATIIRRNAASCSMTGTPGTVERLVPPLAWIYEMDGAFNRSGLSPELMRRLSCDALTTDGGYITSNQCVVHPAVTGFRVRHVMHYSAGALLTWLKTNTIPKLKIGGGLEIKTRGGLDIDTDTLQKRLKSFGPWTILIYRGLAGLTAAVTERVVQDK